MRSPVVCRASVRLVGVRLLAERRGAAAIEFALVAPVFLMFIFLLLDCGRMLFTKQALNELAVATARCAALKATGCTTDTTAQDWAVARAQRVAGMLAGVTATVDTAHSCNGQSSMAHATLSLPLRKGATALLPQSAVPATLTSDYCFPIAA